MKTFKVIYHGVIEANDEDEAKEILEGIFCSDEFPGFGLYQIVDVEGK